MRGKPDLIFLRENLFDHPCYNPVTELLDCPICDRTVPIEKWIEDHIIENHIYLGLEKLGPYFTSSKKPRLMGALRRKGLL